ncbi:DUF1636 family protein [Roseovarius autotrophicus]|uniref:DUF1636 family protein n=1 Tax=Roseovarius autotrophicus TaxID=2824121 RepID=UPI001A0911FA|nr:DUF1636 domain-containing protein [Roseovarius autotrophicus]MBE0453098.1 DUF1636 domain-containing protein [Roseovarius sp.]
MTIVDLLVCTTCRAGNVPATDDAPRAGATLLDQLARDMPDGVRLRGVECLSNCSRGCTIALRGPGRWTYVYGNIAPDSTDLSALLKGVARYRDTLDGLVPWRERPEHFRKNCIARIPPQEAPHD